MSLTGYLIPTDQALNTYMRNTKWIQQLVYVCLCLCVSGGGEGEEKRKRENNNNKIMRSYEIEKK